MNRSLGNLKTNSATKTPSSSRAMSPLVGRNGELRHLTEALELAAKGQGHTIFLTGEPGMGKTRLAREALALAKEQGFRVLEGRAYALDARLAYAPVLDAFGPHLRSCDPTCLGVLVDGLPDLGRLFGDLRLPPPSFPEGWGEPSLEKTRLFEAVSRLLCRLSQEAPVVLFIDDAHWADPATLDLLHYLARGLEGRRVLLLATCRADDLGVPTDWQDLIESFLRADLAKEVIVPKLGPDAVGKLVEGILGANPPAELLTLIRSRAAGTPLFVEAFINALIDTGDLIRSPSGKDGWTLDSGGAVVLPPSIRRLIQRRLARITPADRRILDLIAVLGDGTAHPVLLVASGLEEDTLIESLWRLQGVRLVAEATEGADVVYSITHPLIQEVAYAEMPEMMRRRAHLAAIAALESFSEGRPAEASRLAHHYRGAGSEAKNERSLAVLVAAGERALSLYANEEAARHFDAALAIVRHGRPGARLAGGEEPLLPWLLERLGEARDRIGKREQALEAWNDALVALSEGQELSGPSNGMAVSASRLHRQLALAEWDRGNIDNAIAHLNAGLAALAGRNPCQELADLHFTRLRILTRLGNVSGAAKTVADLVNVAERLASPRAEGEANLAASFFCLWQNDLTSSRERALHALSIGESALGGQELTVCCRAHSALVVSGMRLGDHQFARYHAESGLVVAQRLGAPHLEIIFRVSLAYANLMSGAWDESERCSVEAVALARRKGHPRDQACSLAERAMILALRGDLGQAEACISETRTIFNSGRLADRAVFGFIDILQTILALHRGQTEPGLGLARDLTGQEAPLIRSSAGLMMASMPMAFMLLAEAQIAAGDPEGALGTARKIIQLGPVGTPYLVALASRIEGLAKQALGRPEAAKACLKRAYENFTILNMPFEAARALLDQATLATKTRPDLAVRGACDSLAIFERLGAERYVERARRLLSKLGASCPAKRRSHLGGVQVSERELEIAQLVAQGLTNPEIAARLFLTPGTVGVHLHRIYGRLGIGSRAALAGLVGGAGLNSPHENIISTDYIS